MYFSRLFFALILGFLLSCSSVSIHRQEESISREEKFASYESRRDRIHEIWSKTTDENRCDSEREVSRLLRLGCDDCFDGWGILSYTVDESLEGCRPSELPPECLEEPDWIGRNFSTCSPCGITYRAVRDGEKTLANWNASEEPFMGLEFISCEEFYEVVEKKKKYCGFCLKESGIN